MPCCMIITINSLTTVGWLVTHWSILTNKGEIKEDAALSFGSSLVPHIKHNEMEQLLTVSIYSFSALANYYLSNTAASLTNC